MHQKAFAAFFGIVILAFSFALYAATAATTSAVVSETITPPTQITDSVEEATTTAQTTTEYELPYPGLLPDHPLYKIKLARDRILDFLIRDPVKRIEFNLLMADKRLNMGIFLVDREKYTLAEDIVSKGEKYFVKAIDEYKKAKDEGRTIPAELVEKLRKAGDKHSVVIATFVEKGPEDTKAGFETSLNLARENRSRIESIAQ
jgi:hypothetical protein